VESGGRNEKSKRLSLRFGRDERGRKRTMMFQKGSDTRRFLRRREIGAEDVSVVSEEETWGEGRWLTRRRRKRTRKRRRVWRLEAEEKEECDERIHGVET